MHFGELRGDVFEVSDPMVVWPSAGLPEEAIRILQFAQPDVTPGVPRAASGH
jgi:hypothetical protein